jgi:hypothetical protein
MKWLFLVHQVQTPNSRERVRVWRLTKKVGTLLYRNSVYVLPYDRERLEDFHWLCEQIRNSQGEASVFISEAGDAKEDRALRHMFVIAREKEYAELEKGLQQYERRLAQVQEASDPGVSQVKKLEKGLRQLEETFQEIRRIDFFGQHSSTSIGKRLRTLRLSLAATEPRKETAHTIPRHARSEFREKTWTTRSHIHIDRLCSAWLIKRFIDPKAKFVFAPAERLPQNAIPFDSPGAEFSHRGDRCTFETLLQAFSLKNDALFSMAELVHNIDLKDQKFNRPESAGLDMIVRALSDASRNDAETLEIGSRVLDALYARFSSARD